MYVSEDNNHAIYQIKAYDAESVTVNDQRLTSPFFLTSTTLTPLTVHFETLEIDDIKYLLSELDILIIGCGTVGKPLPASLQTYFDKHDIGVECMTTPAACRSYVVLQSEDRRVAGLFFPC